MILIVLAALAAHDLLDVLVRALLARPAVQSMLQTRPQWRVAAQVIVQLVVAAVVVVVSSTLWGVPGALTALLASAIMLAWAWTHSWWRPAGMMLILVLGALGLLDAVTFGLGSVTAVPVPAVGAVVVLFLMETGNRITRSVLSLAGRPLARQTTRPRSEVAPGDDDELELKGGRFIGPMERILVLGLALAGAEGIIGALMAAKGIVRFPEISADRERGGRAEEFLVGSLTSWGLAAGGVLLLWLWQNS